MAAVLPQRPFTVDEFHRLCEVGILDRDERVELAHPRLDSVLMVIDVADTTLHYDRNLKNSHYGAVGIREAWLVDLSNRLIEVFHDPSPESGYTQSASFPSGPSAESISVPGLSVQVDDVLG